MWIWLYKKGNFREFTENSWKCTKWKIIEVTEFTEVSFSCTAKFTIFNSFLAAIFTNFQRIDGILPPFFVQHSPFHDLFFLCAARFTNFLFFLSTYVILREFNNSFFLFFLYSPINEIAAWCNLLINAWCFGCHMCILLIPL